MKRHQIDGADKHFPHTKPIRICQALCDCAKSWLQLPAATWCVRNGEPCEAQPTLTMGAVVSLAIKVVAASNLSIKTVVQIAACIAVSLFSLCLWLVSKASHTAAGVLFVTAVAVVLYCIRPAVIPVMHTDPKREGVVRVVAISDTHCKHGALTMPAGDILVCAGDFTRRGTVAEIKDFNDWLGRLPYKHKVVVAGNHDLLFDSEFYNQHWQTWAKTKEDCQPDTAQKLLTNATLYLNHEAVCMLGRLRAVL